MKMISKNSMMSRTFIFLISFVTAPFVGVYLLFGQHSILDLVVSILILSVNIIYSFYLAFNDYEFWIDELTGVIQLKSRNKIFRFIVKEVSEVSLCYINSYKSNIYKFYWLIISGQKFRIRYYDDNPENASDLWDPNKKVRTLEEGLRIGLKKYIKSGDKNL